MQSEAYKEYMKSAEWREKRQQRIKIDNMCVMCHRPLNQIRSVQVHHIRYPERFGTENVYSDLCTLCGSCHIKIHNYYNRIKSPQNKREV
jgi:predicted HNH restriction endonuclease